MICDGGLGFLFKINGYDILGCKSCAHRMTPIDEIETHIEKIYSEAYFFGGGKGYPNYLSEQRLLTEHGRRYGRLLKRFTGKTGILLDVGSAAGFILDGMVQEGWEGLGVEPNATMGKYARRELGLKVETGTIESFNSERKFRVICFVQVIAHLLDPKKAMLKAKNLLEPGGFILIETWNWQSLTARIFGKKWHEYSPPSVVHWFSKQSLRKLMKDLGFSLVAAGRPRKRLLLEHAKSLILQTANDTPLTSFLTPFLRSLPEHMAVPYPGEDLFWAVFKRNEGQ